MDSLERQEGVPADDVRGRRRRRVEGSDQLREVRHIVPSDNPVSNGGYLSLAIATTTAERAREVEQRLMTELQQLTKRNKRLEKEEVC